MAVLNAAAAGPHPRKRNALAWALPGLFILGWLFLATTAAAAAVSNEYQIKAAFLYNFAQFVDWPPTAFADAQSPLVIGILGEDPFGVILDETVRGEVVSNRPLLIQRYHKAEEIRTCHILFISHSENSHLDATVTSLRNRSILLVSDLDNFAQRGGMIQFTTANSKIRLRINLGAARASNLTISSKLLRPAEVIGVGHN